MTFDQFSAKTLDEALTNASVKKECPKDQLHYTVLEENAGFLGIGKQVTIEVWAPSDIERFLQEYIQTYFNHAELGGTVEVHNDNGFYRVTVDTSNNAILIGKSGRALQDFNRLVKAAASSTFKKRIGVLVDVNGYKEERYEKLCRMAVRVAKDVARTKVNARLDPMTPDERKAVHHALQSVANVSTKSSGEGSQRCITIYYTPEQ